MNPLKFTLRYVPQLFLVCLPVLAQAPAQKATPQDNAISFHQARVASKPDDTGALRMLAGAYVARAEVTGEAADYDRAWEVLDRAEKLEPGVVSTIAARASLLLSRHRFPQARALAEEGLKRYPEDGSLLGVAGDAALETGDLDAAENFYNKLHALGPRLISWARLAHVAELHGNFDSAASMLERAIEAGEKKAAPPESIAWCLAVLGEVELKRGNLQAARNNYVAGLERSPNHLLVLEHLAELETKEKNLDAAEAAYQRILSQRPDPRMRLRIADLLDLRGKHDQAAGIREEVAVTYQHLVEAGNEGYLRPLAELELAAGRFQQAATLAARDVALRPTQESQAVLRKVLAAAAAAGKPINQF
jgi:tetratricopeptide (TPR) repeat protein